MTRQHEVSLSVSDYLKKGQQIYRGEAAFAVFDKCEADIATAEKVFREEAAESNVKIKEIINITFCEFDSPNAGHASGYFDVAYEGDPFPEDEE